MSSIEPTTNDILVSLMQKVNDLSRKLDTFEEKMAQHNRKMHEMLRVCHEGYKNVLSAQKFTHDRLLESQEDMANTMTNIGWPC